ncbi:6-hydroxy-3-succinoylpyridine 3-monooxygenase HspA [Marinovum algicola]|uniref:NYN domain-containing protein n=1 Tax=Marinovum algicola TaxID=42444 RepID=A0A975WEP6_9RHOB|nr:NYN domain-containing protein [Marinovum algicola]SEK08296.1 NYN domain-containing protein [Marinovum algicola]SLN76546.1 6-hydroxy-3-succinoylpyridine 3-monooxygenase HspA [Marinovum algicola]
MARIFGYVDGFNVYHAIDDANRAVRGARSHLKWLNLFSLLQEFTDPAVHSIDAVKFFTAYPTWNKEKTERHKNYTRALECAGVTIIEGQFKPKTCFCKNCRTNYKAREEKESDVNIAMHLINDAHLDRFDQAFLVTNDSDLLGPVRLLRNTFDDKQIKVIAPPFRRHSKELWAAADKRGQILEEHMERNLLPETANDGSGRVLFRRPDDYRP